MFHRSGWAAAAKAAYGYQDLSLVAYRGDAVAGALPLIDVRAPLLGRSLVSTAFAIGGGPIGDDDGVVAALCDEAAALGAARRANYVEVRSNPALGPDWLEKSDIYASFEIPILSDEDAQLAAIPRRRRAEIRKAIKAAASGRSEHSPVARDERILRDFMLRPCAVMARRCFLRPMLMRLFRRVLRQIRNHHCRLQRRARRRTAEFLRCRQGDAVLHRRVDRRARRAHCGISLLDIDAARCAKG